ncbi:uncharacterized protein LTR77_007313 [Saxophila tyrrhenica]|uniref:Uncharacterized protein n=1 Tax=Saxophila tyrrhenica TaxID=1690608 RepID=A0AAV9P7A8_9PEZI|nr:hypothetical protein LTR77_007313 [Saxophila tyrrhenica]
MGMDSKDDTVYCVDSENSLVAFPRREAPRPATYEDLIWGSKHIMIPKTLHMEARPFMGPYELPKNSTEDIMLFIYAFIQYGEFGRVSVPTIRSHGYDFHEPPFQLRSAEQRPFGPEKQAYRRVCDRVDHIRLFKTADETGFSELRCHALQRLHNVRFDSRSPIEALEEVYNISTDGTPPPHPDLRHWARKFLIPFMPVDLPFRDPRSFLEWHGVVDTFIRLDSEDEGAFEKLLDQSNALWDDTELVEAKLEADCYRQLGLRQSREDWEAWFARNTAGAYERREKLRQGEADPDPERMRGCKGPGDGRSDGEFLYAELIAPLLIPSRYPRI